MHIRQTSFQVSDTVGAGRSTKPLVVYFGSADSSNPDDGTLLLLGVVPQFSPDAVPFLCPYACKRYQPAASEPARTWPIPCPKTNLPGWSFLLSTVSLSCYVHVPPAVVLIPQPVLRRETRNAHRASRAPRCHSPQDSLASARVRFLAWRCGSHPTRRPICIVHGTAVAVPCTEGVGFNPDRTQSYFEPV